MHKSEESGRIALLHDAQFQLRWQLSISVERPFRSFQVPWANVLIEVLEGLSVTGRKNSRVEFSPIPLLYNGRIFEEHLGGSV
jgi:hypothetical protein